MRKSEEILTTLEAGLASYCSSRKHSRSVTATSLFQTIGQTTPLPKLVPKSQVRASLGIKSTSSGVIFPAIEGDSMGRQSNSCNVRRSLEFCAVILSHVEDGAKRLHCLSFMLEKSDQDLL